jgi:hypothetical protein
MARKELSDKEAEFLAQAMRDAAARGAAPSRPQPAAPAPAAPAPVPVAKVIPEAMPDPVAPPPAPVRPDPGLLLELAKADSERQRLRARKMWMGGLLAAAVIAVLWAVINLIRVLMR